MSDASFTTRFDESSSTLLVGGDIDESHVEALRDAVRLHRDEQRPLTIDLSLVTFLPSLALSVLVMAQRAASKESADVTIVAQSGSMAARVLRVASVAHGVITPVAEGL